MATGFPHQPTHFFKIILSQRLHEGKLMIPRKFVKKYGEGLPNTIFLKLPNGTEWKLNLVKRDGKMWFQKGWKEFAEYNSLAHGHLLVFRYKGTSHFQVHIFDKSALEINYPFKRAEAKRVSNVQRNKPPNNENFEDYRAGQKRKPNSPPLEFLQPCKMGSSRCVQVGKSLKLQKVALHHTDRKCKVKSSKPCGICVSIFSSQKDDHGMSGLESSNFSGKQMITAEQVTVLDRASSFKTCNPSFLVTMHPSYIEGHGSLNLPSEFGMRHFDLGKKRGDIHLRVLNGRVWPARYLIREDNTRTKFEVSSGWRAFVKDNNLKVGDVCTFELILGTKLTFLVYIFRKTDNPNCSTSQESSQMRAASQGQRKGTNIITITKSSPPKSFSSSE